MAVFSGNGAIGSPSFTFSSDNDTGFYRPAANELSIVTGGANAIYIDDSQRLGLRNATNPETSIDIRVEDGTPYSSTDIPYDSEAVVRIFNTDLTTAVTKFAGFSLRTYGTTVNRTDATVGLIKTTASGANGALVFGLRNNSFGPIEECMRVTSSKTVGIGLTNPGAALDVDSTGTPLIVRQGGVEAVRVNSSGNVDVADKLLAKQTSLNNVTRHLYSVQNNVAKGTPNTAFTVICSGGGGGSLHRASISFRLLITVNANTVTGGTGYATYAVNGLIRRGDGSTSPIMLLGTPEIVDSYSSFGTITVTPSLQNITVSGADFAIQWDTSSTIAQSRVYTSLEFIRAIANDSSMDILPL